MSSLSQQNGHRSTWYELISWNEVVIKSLRPQF